MSTTLEVTAPSYATDGSRGYHICLSDALRGTKSHGWIQLMDDQSTVIATLNSNAWREVGTVPVQGVLTQDWVQDHKDHIDSRCRW